MKSPSSRRVLVPLGLLLLLLVVIPGARLLRATAQLNRDLDSLQAALSIQSDGLGDVEAILNETARDFRELRSALGPLLYAAPLLGWVPRYGGDLYNAPVLLDLGEKVTASAQDSLAVGKMLVAPGGNYDLVTHAAIDAATSADDSIRAARQNLADAARLRTRLQAGQLTPPLQKMLERFDRVLPLWRMGLDGLALAPVLLGADRPRVYLLLAQNSDELRATGGFISAVALVHANRGDISVSDFQDSYAVDNLARTHPTAPPPLEKYMYAGMWVLRDANWSPDFPRTARVVQDFWAIDRGMTVDGVIAINLKALPRVLQATGPIVLESYNERIEAENVLAQVQDYWAAPQQLAAVGTERWKHRKDLMGTLLQGVMGRLRAGDYDRVQFVRALYDLITRKDVLIYVNDANADAPNPAAWSGALYTGPGDSLMIVDSNVGFNKVDGNIEREADYTVAMDAGGQVQATLTITYTNLSAPTGGPCVHAPTFPPSYTEQQQGCYWNYVRIAAPEGSQLLATSGVDNPTVELANERRAIFAGFLLVPRGEKRMIQFAYRLPPSVIQASRYRLRIETQPGAPPLALGVRVALPWGWSGAAFPSIARQSGGQFEFTFTLDRDVDLEISLNPWRWGGIGVLFVSLMFVLIMLHRRRLRARVTS